MKQLKVVFPTDVNLNTSGIYKLTFSNGYFYFGSTKNFKQRFQLFKHVLLHPDKLHSNKMRSCLKECKSVCFEIIKLVPDINSLRSQETIIIKPHEGNPLLINRSVNGESNMGVKWTEKERRSVSKTMKKKYKSG